MLTPYWEKNVISKITKPHNIRVTLTKFDVRSLKLQSKNAIIEPDTSFVMIIKLGVRSGKYYLITSIPKPTMKVTLTQ